MEHTIKQLMDSGVLVDMSHDKATITFDAGKITLRLIYSYEIETIIMRDVTIEDIRDALEDYMRVTAGVTS